MLNIFRRCYYMSFQCSELSGANVASTSQARPFAISLTAGNYRLRSSSVLQWQNSTKFRENRPIRSNIKGGAHTDDVEISKVELSLRLTKYHAIKTCWGSGDIAPRILDLSTSWRWVVSFTPRQLYSRQRAPGTQWIGGWVGPRAILDAVVVRMKYISYIA